VVNRASSSVSFLRVGERRRALEDDCAEADGTYPKQRPAMLEVAASLSDVDNVGSEREASRPRQDGMEVDEENAKSPMAKKQKLSE